MFWLLTEINGQPAHTPNSNLKMSFYVSHLQKNSSSGTHTSSIPSAPAAEPIKRDTAWRPEKSPETLSVSETRKRQIMQKKSQI